MGETTREIKKYDVEVEVESFDKVFNFIEDILTVLEDQEVKNYNKFLSDKLNYSPAYISNILNGTPNLTVKKMTEIAFSVGYKLSLKIEPIEKVFSVQTSEPLSNTVVTDSCIIFPLHKGKRMLRTVKVPNSSIEINEVNFGY